MREESSRPCRLLWDVQNSGNSMDKHTPTSGGRFESVSQPRFPKLAELSALSRIRRPMTFTEQSVCLERSTQTVPLGKDNDERLMKDDSPLLCATTKASNQSPALACGSIVNLLLGASAFTKTFMETELFL
jgi:hypothetical protein